MQFEYDPERLIEEIRKRPGIWDPEDTDYRSKHVRHHLWNETVTQLLQSDVKFSKSEMRELEIQLQKKWKSIRDCFQKYVTNPNRTKKPYIYTKQLQFLLKNQTTQVNDESSGSEEPAKPKKVWRKKRKLLNLSKDDDTSSEDDGNAESDNNNDTRDSIEEPDVEVPKKVRKAAHKPDEFAFANVDVQKPDSDDCDRMFLLSLLPHLKSIPDEYRINVKLDLMQVLRNANYSVPRDQKLF